MLIGSPSFTRPPPFHNRWRSWDWTKYLGNDNQNCSLSFWLKSFCGNFVSFTSHPPFACTRDGGATPLLQQTQALQARKPWKLVSNSARRPWTGALQFHSIVCQCIRRSKAQCTTHSNEAIFSSHLHDVSQRQVRHVDVLACNEAFNKVLDCSNNSHYVRVGEDYPHRRAGRTKCVHVTAMSFGLVLHVKSPCSTNTNHILHGVQLDIFVSDGLR